MFQFHNTSVFKRSQPAASSSGPSRSHRPPSRPGSSASSSSSASAPSDPSRSRQASLIKSKSTSDVVTSKSGPGGVVQRSNGDSSSGKPVSDYQDFQVPKSQQSNPSLLSVPDHAPQPGETEKLHWPIYSLSRPSWCSYPSKRREINVHLLYMVVNLVRELFSINYLAFTLECSFSLIWN